MTWTRPERVYRIGEIAMELGVTPQALRYYEEWGIIPSPNRNPSGYRTYSEETRARLLFLKRAQRFGFKLDEIKVLLRVAVQRAGSCAEVKGMIDRKRRDLEEQLRQLRRLRSDLERLRRQCEAALARDASCPAMLDFASTVSTEPALSRAQAKEKRFQ